jgi:hypothetical protein
MHSIQRRLRYAPVVTDYRTYNFVATGYEEH